VKGNSKGLNWSNRGGSQKRGRILCLVEPENFVWVSTFCHKLKSEQISVYIW